MRLELPVGRWPVLFLDAMVSEVVSDEVLHLSWGATCPLPLCAATPALTPALIAAAIATASGGRGVKMCANQARCAMELS